MAAPSYRLLLVDDEVHIRQGLAEALAGDEVSVTCAGTGEEAIARLKEQEYHVVITDLRMPGRIGGLDVLRAAREAWPESMTMVITAFGTVDGAVEAMRRWSHSGESRPSTTRGTGSSAPREAARRATERMHSGARVGTMGVAPPSPTSASPGVSDTGPGAPASP